MNDPNFLISLTSMLSQIRERHPELRAVVDVLLELDELELRGWIQKVDESRYSVMDWLVAVSHFYTWIPESGSVGIANALEYLCCCAEGVQSSGPAGSLVDVALEYYQLYGFEGVTRA